MMATQLGNSVMLASMELKDMDGVVPALMDNGASNGTSCSRTLDGAVPGTFCAPDAGDIGLGSEGAVLESKGSWLYCLHRYGTDSNELVVRRLKYTPNLPMAIVFSEASENMTHGYNSMWNAGEQRVMESPEGLLIRLHMSKSKLGYLKVKPETNPQVQTAERHDQERQLYPQVQRCDHRGQVRAAAAGALQRHGPVPGAQRWHEGQADQGCRVSRSFVVDIAPMVTRLSPSPSST